MDKEQLRKQILALGADVCGFASLDRFENTPVEFRPDTIYKDCKSVIVIGIALSKGLYQVEPRLIYGHFNYGVCPEVDITALHIAKLLEEEYGVYGIPLPSDSPYEYWNEEEMKGHGLLSMKHAAVAAGLGQLGKSTLLLNKQYGNRLIVGAVLTDLEIESDPLAESICLEKCHLCVDNCPSKAIQNGSVIQKNCRLNTYGKTKRGFDTVDCNNCRTICPMRFGK